MNHTILKEFSDQEGISIHDHSLAAPMLLMLLRHAGCPFCRRTLNELSAMRDEIYAHGYTIGLVHMSGTNRMQELLSTYRLKHIPTFHDPDKRLYQELNLKRLPVRQLFNHRTWARGLQIGFHHGISWPDSDPRQLPGAFLVDQGLIVAGHTSLSPSDPPDFKSLVRAPELVA